MKIQNIVKSKKNEHTIWYKISLAYVDRLNVEINLATKCA